MNHFVSTSVCRTTQLLRSRAVISIQTKSFGVALGDKVPVNYIKDGVDPVIRPDSEYPDYVLKLTDPLPTKNELLKMIKEAGGIDGDLTVLGIKNIKRAKRLMGLDLVKTNNARSKND